MKWLDRVIEAMMRPPEPLAAAPRRPPMKVRIHRPGTFADTVARLERIGAGPRSSLPSGADPMTGRDFLG